MDADQPPAEASSTRPRQRLRRGAIAVAMFAAGSVLSGAGAVWANHQFTDVPTNHPFHNDIDWLTKNGIAQGYPGEVFKPADPVSRQAFAAFLHRYNDEIEVVSVTKSNYAPNGTFFALTIPCPAGKRAIGGGGAAFGLDVNKVGLTRSSASTGFADWQITYESMNGNPVTLSSVVGFATCVPQ